MLEKSQLKFVRCVNGLGVVGVDANSMAVVVNSLNVM